MAPSFTIVHPVLIVAACVFALVKVVNKLKREEAVKPEPSKTEALLGEIRDLLKKGPRGLSACAVRASDGGGLIFQAFAARLAVCRLWFLAF